MFDWLKQYNKAIISAVAAGAAMFLSVYLDDRAMSGDDWWAVIGAAAAAGGFTWAVPNKPQPTATAEHRAE